MTALYDESVKPRTDYAGAAYAARLRRRRASEKRFRLFGLAAVGFAGLMLVLLLGSVLVKGMPAFFQARYTVEIYFDPEILAPGGDRSPDTLLTADYQALARTALLAHFPDATGRDARKAMNELLSTGAGDILRELTVADPSVVGTRRKVTITASDTVDQVLKGHIPRTLPESHRNITDRQLAWIDQLAAAGVLTSHFSLDVLTRNNSRQPELAGMWGALMGSFYTMLVTLALSLPVGVAAAIYLEEFSSRNRWTGFVEVNINNLAAVPSIVFGLLGLSVFLNTFGLPRSSALLGGMVLALMTLPTIIIASRAALKAVPPSIREAALGIGASPMQVVLHHVLPLAAPGVLTGTILGIARALGETAPLLMIGMIAFIVDPPQGFVDPSTVLPVQIYMWADSPERGWIERTSAAILLLLSVLVLMNALAVWLRRRFERRW